MAEKKEIQEEVQVQEEVQRECTCGSGQNWVNCSAWTPTGPNYCG